MIIETPSGSGNTIEIFKGGNGNIAVTIKSKDCADIKSSASVEFLGIDGGHMTKEQEDLLEALSPFVD